MSYVCVYVRIRSLPSRYARYADACLLANPKPTLLLQLMPRRDIHVCKETSDGVTEANGIVYPKD